MSLLQDEINWIVANQSRYDSPMHARAVIGNITKRYKLTEQQKAVEKFARNGSSANLLAMLETFGVDQLYLNGGTNGSKKH